MAQNKHVAEYQGAALGFPSVEKVIFFSFEKGFASHNSITLELKPFYDAQMFNDSIFYRMYIFQIFNIFIIHMLLTIVLKASYSIRNQKRLNYFNVSSM